MAVTLGDEQLVYDFAQPDIVHRGTQTQPNTGEPYRRRLPHARTPTGGGMLPISPILVPNCQTK